MSPTVRAPSDAPVVLRGPGVTSRVRPWPGEPRVAQLVLYPPTRPLRPGDLDAWLDDLRERGYLSVRTNALGGQTAHSIAALGFASVQRLVLLAHTDPAGAAVLSAAPTIRLDARHDRVAADVDRAAFDAPWALDAAAVADVRHATPRHRMRGVRGEGSVRSLAAFAISGRDGRQGFLQRLAVHPEHQRRGHGAALVGDALRWMDRWRVGRVLVNTHADNDAALALYDRLGFARLDDELQVFERSLS